MRGQYEKCYVLIPVTCGQIVAVEVCGGVTEVDAIAEIRRFQKRLIVVISTFACVELLAAGFYSAF